MVYVAPTDEEAQAFVRQPGGAYRGMYFSAVS